MLIYLYELLKRIQNPLKFRSIRFKSYFVMSFFILIVLEEPNVFVIKSSRKSRPKANDHSPEFYHAFLWKPLYGGIFLPRDS